MKCPACRTDNRAQRRFCSACGKALPVACPRCAFANEPDDAFCGGCGERLPGTAQEGTQARETPAAYEAAPSRHGQDGERRQITVMFCDLAGSTPLAARLDPEDLREVIRTYQAACAAVIERYEGHIAQFLGDGLVVYFGHPQAHEDDAQRAVRAGLGILASIRDLSARLTPQIDVALSVRIGVHTGLVVVGAVGGGQRREQLALGETPNLAARLQGLADENGLVISAATQRLVQGFFITADAGEHALKGFADPVRVFRVHAESGVRNRLDASAEGTLTPLVGRDQELGLLLDRWRSVVDGQGQVVLVTGDPGIGKSRLVQAVSARIADEPHTRLEFRCSPYHANSPLYPVIDLLPEVLGYGIEDSPAVRMEKLEQFGRDYGLSPTEGLPLLAALLSLPRPEGAALPPMSPERQKQRTLETLLGLVLALAAREPVLVVVEDLHWMDPTTLELLHLLIEQAPGAGLFALLTARHSFQPQWAPHSHIATLTLNRFTHRQTQSMVELLAGKPLPAEVVQQIVSKTDGVPLFVEELTRMVLESGLLHERADCYALEAPLPPLAIPASLQDSLTARLDRLADVKTVAQLGATIGRTVPYALLRAVARLDEASLQRELARLVDAELLHQRGVPPDAVFIFKHALIQEAAYNSLLKSTRQQYHERIARTMIEQFGSEAEAQPEIVANHYSAAGIAHEAVSWWHRAGQRAVQRAAYAEAGSHFRKGLEALAQLPESVQRAPTELGLQIALGYALIPVKGWSSPDTAAAFTRAGDLCAQIGEVPQLFRALWGLGAFHFVRGDQRKAREAADQCLALAQQTEDADSLIEAHYLRGMAASASGEFPAGQSLLERCVQLYGPGKRDLHALLYGQDPKASALAWLAMDLWVLGYPDQALQRAREGLEFVRAVANPFALARNLAGLGFVHVFRREPQPMDGPLGRAIALCVEQGFPYFRAVVSTFQASNLALLGQLDDAHALLVESIGQLRAIGSELFLTVICGNLAELCLMRREYAEGLAAVTEGLAVMERNGEYWGEAELYRLRGDLLLAAGEGDPAQAEACFQRAIRTARGRQARAYELRATTSLGRLWRTQGKRADARVALHAALAWFEEGLDTADLRDAAALLQEFELGAIT